MRSSKFVGSLRRGVAAALAVASIGAGVAGFARGDVAAADAAAGPVAATPVWSLRRLPGPAVDVVTSTREQSAAVQLQQALDAETGRYGLACEIVARGATVLTSRNADAPMVPASTQKVLTAVGALTKLGPDFRFESRAVASSSGPSVDRLWFVGSGDPVIRTAEYMDEGVSTPLEALADSIVAHGIKHVGAVIGDDSRYDGQRFLPSWSPSYRTSFDIGPLGALTVTQGIILVRGKPVMMDDPALFAASELTRLLRARGVTVAGDPGRGTAPANATRVGTMTSQPLTTILGWMLRTSDNLSAELLTKELGLKEGGQGTTAAGVAAIQATLRGLGVNLDGQTMIDGSGLDRGNRLTCRILASVVGLVARPDLKVLRDLLPPATRAGAGDRVRAKGGYLTDVTGLAGLVEGQGQLTFAFLANGGVPPAANAELARFLAPLTAYRPPDPATDAFVPVPAALGSPPR